MLSVSGAKENLQQPFEWDFRISTRRTQPGISVRVASIYCDSRLFGGVPDLCSKMQSVGHLEIVFLSNSIRTSNACG